MKVATNRLDRGFFKYQDEFEQKALEVLRSGWYILGNEVKAFEQEFAEYTGTKYCVGLASIRSMHPDLKLPSPIKQRP